MIAARFLVFSCLLLLLFALATSAQRTRRPAPRPTPKPTPTVSPVITAAKAQVANQLFNVNVFVDKMGPVAVAIEEADREAKAGRLKRESIDVNEANKKKVIAAIRGLRDGLVSLETEFRTRPQLTQYLATIQGIGTLCARAEDSAIAGQFVASKDPLRQVALKLNDTLAILPGPPVNTGYSPPVVNKPASEPKPALASTGKREPVLGMTTTEVLASTWGAPINKRVSTTSNGTTEVWTYSGNRSLYFFNGKVTNIVR